MKAPNIVSIEGVPQLTPEAIQHIAEHGWCYVDGQPTHVGAPHGAALLRALCEAASRQPKPHYRLTARGDLQPA
jgi:hypothetical protein